MKNLPLNFKSLIHATISNEPVSVPTSPEARAAFRQELFDRAVHGLRGQGFQQAFSDQDGIIRCAYQGSDGKRCAWGHVDTSLTTELGSVSRLSYEKIGVARGLDTVDVIWAMGLQKCHDLYSTPAGMIGALREFADKHSLIYPE